MYCTPADTESMYCKLEKICTVHLLVRNLCTEDWRKEHGLDKPGSSRTHQRLNSLNIHTELIILDIGLCKLGKIQGVPKNIRLGKRRGERSFNYNKYGKNSSIFLNFLEFFNQGLVYLKGLSYEVKKSVRLISGTPSS